MILSKTFHVSTDVLLHDDYVVNSVKEAHSCGANAVQEHQKQFFEGILIKESIEDDSVIDCLAINKMELWNTGGNPRYWTVLFFTSEQRDLPERFSKVMISNPESNWSGYFSVKRGLLLKRFSAIE